MPQPFGSALWCLLSSPVLRALPTCAPPLRSGIVGANGAGKSTLLRMIAGEGGAPRSGTITVGSSVRIGVVSQSRDELDAGKRVVDVVGAGSDTVAVGDTDIPVRQYLAGFNIVGELQSKLIGKLSGGEVSSQELARAVRHQCARCS